MFENRTVGTAPTLVYLTWTGTNHEIIFIGEFFNLNSAGKNIDDRMSDEFVFLYGPLPGKGQLEVLL